jgi:hypothetical protein
MATFHLWREKDTVHYYHQKKGNKKRKKTIDLTLQGFLPIHYQHSERLFVGAKSIFDKTPAPNLVVDGASSRTVFREREIDMEDTSNVW